MIIDMLNFATHIASQICRHPFERVFIPPQWTSEHNETLTILDSSCSDWSAILKQECCSLFPSLNWLSAFLTRTRMSVEGFAGILSSQVTLCRENGGSIVGIWEDYYPPLLREIAEPPLLLFTVGKADILKSPCVSIIGSRKASHDAIEQAASTASMLVASGLNVVSGGALGCDIAAHIGALNKIPALGKPVCILAGGLDQLAPRSNEKVFSQIVKHGGILVSERLWGSRARPVDFPIRNRLISGMSQATLVIQCSEKSGSMMTAKFALDQGRDVFVFDAFKDDVRALGNRILIEEGASTFSSHEQVFDLLGYSKW